MRPPVSVGRRPDSLRRTRMRFAAGRSGAETAVDLFSYAQTSLEHLQRLFAWLLADVLIPVNLVQVPAVALSGGVAWLVARPLCKWLCGWIERTASERPKSWVARHREWAIKELVPLVTPSLWASGL